MVSPRTGNDHVSRPSCTAPRNDDAAANRSSSSSRRTADVVLDSTSPATNGLVRHLGDRRVQGDVHESLLPLGAADVGGAVDVPLAVFAELLVVPAARIGERLHTVEHVTAGLGDVQARVLVASRIVEAHLDPTDRVDEVLEPEEVDLDVVVDGDAQRLCTVCTSTAGPSLYAELMRL